MPHSAATDALPSPEASRVPLEEGLVRVLLWKPAAPPPWGAVIRMHGATESAADLPPWAPDLLAAGVAVVSFSARRHGERGEGVEAYGRWLREDPVPRYLQVLTGTARDIAAVATWLRARPEVAPERLGLWGGSLGGGCCLAAARVVRPRAISSVCAFADYERTLAAKPVGRLRPEDLRGATDAHRALMREYDPVRHIGAFPPIALLMVHGDHDDIVPPDGQRRLYELLAPAYRATPERLAYLSHPGGHPTPPWCERAAADWLRVWLRA